MTKEVRENDKGSERSTREGGKVRRSKSRIRKETDLAKTMMVIAKEMRI